MSISFENPQMFKRLFRKWKNKQLLITVTPLFRKRSDRQNRYLWGVIVPCIQAWLLETTGKKYTADEVYSWVRLKLIGEKPKIVEIDGTEVMTFSGKRFSQMSVEEFTEVVELILQLMSEKGCYIPEPRKENLLTDYTNAKDY